MSCEIKLGDYVNYSPEPRTSKKYKIFDRGEYEETDIYFSTQIGKNALKWRYMGKDEKGNVILVADRPTSDYLYLYGKDGYVNGPNTLNDLCKELYSSQMGEARSINVEDVNKILRANPLGIYYRRSGYTVTNREGLTIGEIICGYWQPELEETETPEKGKNINDYVVNYYDYVGIAYQSDKTEEHKLIFRDLQNFNMCYWLASSCVFAYFNLGLASFYIRVINEGHVYSVDLFTSNGNNGGDYYPVRPVVTLNSNIQIGEKENGVWTLK